MRGFLRKMTNRLNDPVDYYLPLGEEEFHLNPYLGDRIQLIFHGRIRCLHCGQASKKSYGQGFCYPCFKKLPQCDLCIVSPERCHFEKGTCRDSVWGKEFCMQPHLVYLANSSGVKVGITKPDQLPTRWIDQGAVQAVPIFRVNSRQVSGLVETIFKQHVTDKTQWRRMLKGDNPPVDLKQTRDDLMGRVTSELSELQDRFGLQAVQAVDTGVQDIIYPVQQYPTKIVSMNFDKTPSIEGTLLGIKGQYLIFDCGVINLRRFTSYDVELKPASSGLF